MEITEIRIKLMESSEDRLRAFCSITIDGCFVVRDLKIIDGSNGPFVAMPSRKLTGHCGRCHHKNHLRANYCNNCGNRLEFEQEMQFDSPQKLYADVAHPINSSCRELIQDAVIEEFEAELKRCEQPGYRSRYDDDFADAGEDVEMSLIDPPHDSPRPPKFSSRKEQRPRQSSVAEQTGSQQRNASIQTPGEDGTDDKSSDEGDFGAGIF